MEYLIKFSVWFTVFIILLVVFLSPLFLSEDKDGGVSIIILSGIATTLLIMLLIDNGLI